MESPIYLHYRINSHGGFLFVRELECGEVVARIPSEKSTMILTEMDDVIRHCTHTFLGRIQTVTRDDDSIYVTCEITANE